MIKSNLMNFGLFAKRPTIDKVIELIDFNNFDYIDIHLVQKTSPYDERIRNITFDSYDDFWSFAFHNKAFYIRSIYTFNDLESYSHIVIEVV